MDIEIVDNKVVDYKINKNNYFDGSVCVMDIQKQVFKSFIKDKDTYFTNREVFNNLLEDLINEAYSQGYFKGVRENGTETKQSIGNNWDSDKVYPKGRFNSKYKGD